MEYGEANIRQVRETLLAQTLHLHYIRIWLFHDSILITGEISQMRKFGK